MKLPGSGKIFKRSGMVKKIQNGNLFSKKKTTIYEIAEQAGVSITTVSRVLNNSPLVSENTRKLVQAVIENNHFSPNALAQGLSNNESRSIGVVLPDITNPYFSSLFLEIERYSLEQNYSVVLFNTLYGSFSQSFQKTIAEPTYFKMIIDKRLDGVIITGGQLDKDLISPEYLASLNELQKQLPVVIIGQRFEGANCVFVQRGLASGVFAAIRHLYALGHKRIGFLGGEPGVRITTDRFHAYKQALETMNLPYNPKYVHFSDYYIPDGYAAMQAQLRSERPTAFIAINDMVALGAIRAIADAGLRVPEDIAMVSCDSFYFGEYSVPRLTSLDQQNDYLGRLAIISLINLMKGVDEDVPISHNPRLIVRESCGAQLGIRRME
jgi:LacI family transcriptional regulator